MLRVLARIQPYLGVEGVGGQSPAVWAAGGGVPAHTGAPVHTDEVDGHGPWD